MDIFGIDVGEVDTTSTLVGGEEDVIDWERRVEVMSHEKFFTYPQQNTCTICFSPPHQMTDSSLLNDKPPLSQKNALLQKSVQRRKEIEQGIMQFRNILKTFYITA